MSQPPTTHRAPSPTRSVPARLTLIVLIGLLLWVGTLQLRPPSARPAGAPATDFSAERAMAQLRTFATEPRPAGSEGSARARQYVIDQLTALGLQPEVQTANASVRFPGGDSFTAGTVSNVVVRIPGSASGGAILLDAHYDGGSTGPAASDNGSGVVATLETLRAVLAGPPLRNDVIAVFTDAEEDEDLGAVAFAGQHPLMADVRVAINFEAQGADGPALPYISGPGDSDWLVSELVAAVPQTAVNSLLLKLSDVLAAQRPGCDLHEYLDRGVAGIGFVYFGNTNVYHTILDNVDTLDPGTIQQEGDYTLALVRRLGDRDLTQVPAAAEPHVFFTLFPGAVVRYPAAWSVGIAAVVSAMLGALLALGLRRRILTVGGLAGATGAFLGGTLLTVALVTALWAGVRLANANYQVTMAGTYQTVLLTVALSAAGVALVATLWALLRRGVRPANLAAGAVLLWTLLTWATSAAAPTISYLFAWPLLFALLPLGWLVLAGGRSGGHWGRVAVLGLGAVPGLVFLPANLYQILGWLNRFAVADLPALGLVSIFVAPVAVLLVPHMEFIAGDAGRRGSGWSIAAVTAGASVLLIAFAIATSGFSSARPRPDQIAYELNANSGRALWVSPDAHLDGWTSRFIPEDTVRGTVEVLPGKTVPAYTAPAPALPLPAPTVALVSETTAGAERTVRLHVTSPRGATRLEVMVQADGAIAAAALDGRPLDLSGYAQAAAGTLRFEYVGMVVSGADLAVTVSAGAAVTVTVRDVTYGRPDVTGLTPAERPADTMPGLLSPRDATIVTSATTF